MIKRKYITLTGDVANGIDFTGPFEDWQAADSYRDRIVKMTHRYCTTAMLHVPTTFAHNRPHWFYAEAGEYIVMYGNVWAGASFYGPFASHETGQQWIASLINADAPGVVVPLNKYSKSMS